MHKRCGKLPLATRTGIRRATAAFYFERLLPCAAQPQTDGGPLQIRFNSLSSNFIKIQDRRRGIDSPGGKAELYRITGPFIRFATGFRSTWWRLKCSPLSLADVGRNCAVRWSIRSRQYSLRRRRSKPTRRLVSRRHLTSFIVWNLLPIHLTNEWSPARLSTS